MRIVVVGDVLLDTDLSGDAGRLSPDAPVPVVDVDAVRRRAGGAGLVARMLEADGHEAVLVTVLGDDDAAVLLRAELDGITVVAGPSGAPTPVKTRVRASGQPVVRFDEGCATPLVPACSAAMIAALEGADAVIAADYGRGLLANVELRRRLEAMAGSTPVVWDPHPSGAQPVPGVAAVTPNLGEALRFAGSTESGTQGAAAAADDLLARWGSRAVIVTMGEHGALVAASGLLPQVVPAPRVTASDPCGAGDRFASALAVALAEGRTVDAAAHRATEAAAHFLGSGGVGALGGPRGEAPRQLPVDGLDALTVAQRTRDAGGTVVATGGCFDLLHAGHARTLAAARRLGDCLIVCLNSDESVRGLKGEHRPIIRQEDRAELLAALECVDAVLVFGESTPENAISRLRPDIWVKGGDYAAEDLPEAALVSTWGGRTVTVPYIPARSTTKLAAALARVG
ncbi:bifunctional heptose 7-phosphate kinase/heptose 1-phosphate adenyltransferase [Arthrobacter agilis]|uniref:PfkB family carbohydrate kinase n=1 Tax=Arthrobacter agilis TaxID=37921 RepID=UPI000B35C2D4|nr:PfkB family carbohydrate kinase [Arthrobacter agilis]OUM44202.1 D-beta-D-heptose 1-phosphate adenosyltransferase [Arthrobacter agilis]PPB46576.1 bifunctional heptose 7-phosphate kinase/heptose 1-phosphate adenyltransferase [Arthrobacter agilis]TPV23766.1 bifunctional heptose 7-phosphate kinase/heptose 1-phosphate adenyltransferase [Arthrobacter agilis]VDR32496.1 Bifunctional protein hldE [Arthrobacter agilis]